VLRKICASLSSLAYIPPYTVLLLALGIILILGDTSKDGKEISMNIAVVVGIVAIVVAVVVAIWHAWKFKRDLDNLRKNSIDPLRESLNRGHKAQLHEKLAMIEGYIATGFGGNTGRVLQDIQAALALEYIASDDERIQWIKALDRLISYEDSKEIVGELKHYQSQWNKH